MNQTHGWRTFLHVLVNTAVAGLTTNFIWFALVFWVYLETKSIFVTGILSGAYMLLLAVCSMWFGSLIDRYQKRGIMLVSAWFSLVAFSVGAALYFVIPKQLLLDLRGPWFWLFTVILLAGCIVELLRSLALSTMVTLLVPRERHANANGLVGTVQGLSFIITSVFSGLSIGLLGMNATMLIALVATAIPVIHLLFLRIDEPKIAHATEVKSMDFAGGFIAIRAVPGLIALIIFSMINNLGSGVHMALLDAYGLTMFSPELWGTVFGIAGTGYILGGLIIAKRGLGANPLRTMLLMVILIGLIGSVLALREWWWLLFLGLWSFMLLMPAIEAAEQTVIQRVVPYEKQGRVFGLAMAIEAAAAPITSFLIAPIAQFWVVPYMSTSRGSEVWGWLLGEGEPESRGIALIFVFAGLAISLVGLLAFFTRSYRTLSKSFREAPAHSITVGE